MDADWIDITRPVHDGMEVWPGDPPVHIARCASLDAGDSCNVTALSLCAHTGTHVDAPLHYVPNGLPVDAMPPEAGIGPARVIEIDLSQAITAAGIDVSPGERILFKGRGGEVRLGIEAARRLAARRPRLVGVESLSVGPAGGDGDQVHRVLLAAGVWILEGLDLSRVPGGEYQLVCLPLRLEGADGAPARALLKPAGGLR